MLWDITENEYTILNEQVLCPKSTNTDTNRRRIILLGRSVDSRGVYLYSAQ